MQVLVLLLPPSQHAALGARWVLPSITLKSHLCSLKSEKAEQGCPGSGQTRAKQIPTPLSDQTAAFATQNNSFNEQSLLFLAYPGAVALLLSAWMAPDGGFRPLELQPGICLSPGDFLCCSAVLSFHHADAVPRPCCLRGGGREGREEQG